MYPSIDKWKRTIKYLCMYMMICYLSLKKYKILWLVANGLTQPYHVKQNRPKYRKKSRYIYSFSYIETNKSCDCKIK